MIHLMEKMRSGQRGFIVCIGDSITEQNRHTQGSLNYVGRLGEKLMETFDRRSFVFNSGVSGHTTRDALGRLERDCLRFGPDLVTVMFGMNDAVSGADKLPEFRRNLGEMINRVRGAGCELLLLTANPIDPDVPDNAARRLHYPDYVRQIRLAAYELGVPLCDIYEQWAAAAIAEPGLHGRMMDDPLHPNARGHAFMAQCLYAELGLPML